jgi:hypothetical protein
MPIKKIFLLKKIVMAFIDDFAYNTTGATSGAGTAYPYGKPAFTRGFSGVCVTRSLGLIVMFCRLLFVLLSFFFWPLYCLSFDVRILITPLVSSSFSYRKFSGIRPTCFLNLNPLGEHTKEFVLNKRLRKPMGQS